ncbi:MAG: PAS domain S-box protein [Vicinamibacteria bacterium]|nr:PAS domain S-box protein [Vicinamibacteria bacterium]
MPSTAEARETPRPTGLRAEPPRPRGLAAANEQLRARNRQLAAVAALGQVAIGSRDLPSLMDEAAGVAAVTLDATYSIVAQAVGDGTSFAVRAGRGWKEGTIGVTLSGAGTPAEYLLSSGQPLVIADVATESRFPIPDTMIEHGVVSAIYVIIRAKDRPWGILAAYMTYPRAFSNDDVDFLQSAANVVALAVERQGLEDATRRKNEILQAIFENIPVMISSFDPSGRLQSANKAWEKTLGWTLEEAQQVDIVSLVYPDPSARQEVVEFMRHTERQWKPFRPRTRDGQVLDTLWTRVSLSDGSEIGFGLDITERNQAAAALAASEARFAKLFEASPVALGMATFPTGEIVAVNDSWQRFYGYTAKEVVGRTGGDLNISVDPRAKDAVFSRLAEVGTVRDFETQVRVKSGEVRDVIASVVLLRDGSGPAHVLSAQTDITELKRAHLERDRLLESERMAREGAERALIRLSAIQRVMDAALLHRSLDDLLAALLSRLRAALHLESSTVMLIDPKTHELFARAWDGHYVPDIGTVRVPLGKGLSGRIATEGRPLIVNDGAVIDIEGIKGTAHAARTSGQALIGAPLEVGGRIIGAVTAAAAKPRRFSNDDLEIIRLVADRAGPAIERARLVNEAQEAQERLAALSRRLLSAHEDERRRVAGELHDELGQILTAVKINLESLALSDPAAAALRLADATRSVDHAMHRVRDIALDLRPSVLDDLGLPPALRWYVDRFARAAKVEARVAIDAVPELDPQIETACFRVAQEALTNVARHAQAKQVRLNLSLVPDGLELSVVDDGIGFDVTEGRLKAARGASMGLLGMEERVSLAGGRFEVTATKGGGTRVRALFPVQGPVRGSR